MTKDWTTDIDHPKYKETRRKFKAQEPLTAEEALMAAHEFDGVYAPDGHAFWECHRHLGLTLKELEKAKDRVALLEAEMQITDPHKYKTALEQAFDDCSKLIDGDTNWQYAGQMVQAVRAVVEERDELRVSVIPARIHSIITGLEADCEALRERAEHAEEQLRSAEKGS
jgi:hypothetical protein